MKSWNTKVVYILGAGSTISHSNSEYPDIKNIFTKAIELNIIKDKKNKLKSEYLELNSYMENTFGYDLLNYDQKVDFEKVFTFIEIEIEKDPITFGIIRKQLIEMLITVFTRLKDKIPSSRTTEYNSLVENLAIYDTIITFNWDFLLDDALGRIKHLSNVGKNDQQTDFDKDTSNNKISSHLYFNFITLRELKGYRETLKLKEEPSFYLKLHGSVDWKICKNNFCDKFNEPLPTLYPLKFRNCEYCLEPTEILIVPPTLQKSISQIPVIRIQWNIAKKEISIADKIVIWGYSLPLTDFYAEWLLRNALKNNNLKEVIVINPNDKDAKKFEELTNYFINKPKFVRYNYFSEFFAGISNLHKSSNTT